MRKTMIHLEPFKYTTVLFLLLSGCLESPISAIPAADTGVVDAAVLDSGHEDDEDDASIETADMRLDAESDWVAPTCQKRVPFKLNNSFGILVNFAVRLEIPPLVQADFTDLLSEDVQFFDAGGAVLPFELEDNGYWVMTTVEEGESVLWLYFACDDSRTSSGVWPHYAAVYHLNNSQMNSATGQSSLTCESGNCNFALGVGASQGYSPQMDKYLVDANLTETIQVDQGEVLTISLWYRRDSDGATGPLLVAKSDCAGWSINYDITNELEISFTPTEFNGGCNDVGQPAVHSRYAAGAQNEFHHLVVTLDRSKNEGSSTIWHDGEHVMTDTFQNTLGGGTATQLIFGRLPGTSDTFGGLIDEVRIFRQVPKNGEVMAHYKNLKPGVGNRWVALDRNSVQTRDGR